MHGKRGRREKHFELIFQRHGYTYYCRVLGLFVVVIIVVFG